MLGRRRFLFAGGAVTAAASFPSLAQGVVDDRLYGYPGAIRPFDVDVYRERRARLMASMKDGVAVIYGPRTIDLGNVSAPIDGAASDFFYLTGIRDIAGAALLLAPGERYREILFLPSRASETDRFEGVTLPVGNEVRRRTGFAKVSRTTGLGGTLTEIAARAANLRYLGPLVAPDNPVPPELELYGKVVARVPGTSTANNSGLVRAMRAAKEPRELELMRKAIDVTGRAQVAAMKAVRPGMTEAQLRTIIEDEFRRHGALRVAFPTIVGVARNSTVLHFLDGDTVFRPGDLVLCDIGCEFSYYASDITRTFPVDGRFTDEQRKVYDVVLEAQNAAAAKLRAGVVYDEAQLAANSVMDRAGYRDDFWHGLGHFVGLDVHDVGDYAKPLTAGAVVTIEPGIYLPARAIGVRIEDEYLVTAGGNEHMSRNIPRTPADIEAVMASR